MGFLLTEFVFLPLYFLPTVSILRHRNLRRPTSYTILIGNVNTLKNRVYTHDRMFKSLVYSHIATNSNNRICINSVIISKEMPFSFKIMHSKIPNCSLEYFPYENVNTGF